MFCSMGGGYCRSNQGGTNCWNHGIMFRGNGETERKSGGREDNRQRRVKERNISPSYFSYCSFWVSVFFYSFWVFFSSFLVGIGGGGQGAGGLRSRRKSFWDNLGSEEARQFVSAWEQRCWTVKSVFSGSGRLLLWSVAPLINSDLSFPHSHNFVPSSILFIPSMWPGPDRFPLWNQIHLALDYLLEQAERGMRQIERGAIWLKSLSVIASPG